MVCPVMPLQKEGPVQETQGPLFSLLKKVAEAIFSI